MSCEWIRVFDGALKNALGKVHEERTLLHSTSRPLESLKRLEDAVEEKIVAVLLTRRTWQSMLLRGVFLDAASAHGYRSITPLSTDEWHYWSTMCPCRVDGFSFVWAIVDVPLQSLEDGCIVGLASPLDVTPTLDVRVVLQGV